MATILITDTDNSIVNKGFYYLLGFQPSLWWILIKKNSVTLFFDDRYFEWIKKLNKKKILEKTGKNHIEFKNVKWNLIDDILYECSTSNTLKLEERLTLKYFNEINSKSDLGFFLNPKKTEVIENYFLKKRIKKSRTEKIKLKKAIKIIEEVFLRIEKLNNTWDLKWKTEKFVWDFIIKNIIELWWEAESFNSIVAFWKNSAIPHHQTWNTKIWNWPLLIDMWAIYEWYRSDFTNTSCKITTICIWIWDKTWDYEKFEQIYNIAKKAHNETKKIAKPWISAMEIDKKARDIITDAWYWEYFTHSTWHWIWLNNHEAPYISKNSNEIITKDMVFTIEPWIYLPWKFWVRYENIIFV